MPSDPALVSKIQQNFGLFINQFSGGIINAFVFDEEGLSIAQKNPVSINPMDLVKLLGRPYNGVDDEIMPTIKSITTDGRAYKLYQGECFFKSPVDRLLGGVGPHLIDGYFISKAFYPRLPKFYYYFGYQFNGGPDEVGAEMFKSFVKTHVFTQTCRYSGLIPDE